jgi:hypothetical protein
LLLPSWKYKDDCVAPAEVFDCLSHFCCHVLIASVRSSGLIVLHVTLIFLRIESGMKCMVVVALRWKFGVEVQSPDSNAMTSLEKTSGNERIGELEVIVMT